MILCTPDKSFLIPNVFPPPSSQIKSSADREPSGTPLLLYLQRLLLSPPSGSEERAPRSRAISSPAVLVLPVHRSSVQLLPFPVCPKWSAIQYPGTQEGAGVAMSPRPPPLVCQGPGLYFERSAIFTSSSPSQLSSFPQQPSPGRRRRRQSPPPSSSFFQISSPPYSRNFSFFFSLPFFLKIITTNSTNKTKIMDQNKSLQRKMHRETERPSCAGSDSWAWCIVSIPSDIS